MRIPEVIAAITTPFTDDGALDQESLRANLHRFTDLLDGVFIAGTSGEFPALTAEEHLTVVRSAVEILGPERVIVHIGAASVRQALTLADHSLAQGARRFAAITPYYLATELSETARHYARLRTGLEGVALYAYLFPDTAGTDVAPAGASALLEAGVDGFKLSGRAANRVADFCAVIPDDIPVWSGNDGEVPAVLAAGGRGVISGVAGVAPGPWSELQAACRNDDTAAIDDAQRRIQRLVAALGPSIAHLKQGLRALGVTGPACRMTMTAPDADARHDIASALALSGAAR